MYYKIFDKCNIIYIKNKHNIEEFIESLKGKTVISDFRELSDLFNLKGIVHILNVDNKCLNEKIDCIVAGKRNGELESKLISLGSESHILYIVENALKKWCCYCHGLCDINDDNIITRYCSEECMTKNSKFMQNFKESINDLDINNIKGKQYVLIEFEKNHSNSNKKISENKSQTSIVKNAIRLEYAIKREIYKKEMRQPSLRRASSSIKKECSEERSDLCKGHTKKGERCNNKTVGSTCYCGITSHAKN
jgi:hypothetical protein